MTNRSVISVVALCAAATAASQVNVPAVTQIGRNALYFEDYMLSIRYFNKAIEARPDLAEPYFLRGLAKYNLDDMRGAEIDATSAIQRNPFILDAYELRGVSRHALGNLEGAVEDYSRILRSMPENRLALFNMALAQEELGRPAEADSTFTRLLQVAPRYDAGFLGRARLRLERGDTVGARADADKALELNDYNVNAHTMMAELCRAAGDTASLREGLAHADRAIRLSPNVPGLYVNRAFFKHSLDDFEGAMSDFDYAVELDPTSYIALYNRALLRIEVSDFNRAIDDLNRVMALRGTDYRALFNRAMVYKELGYLPEALADADAVVAAFPTLAAAYFLRYDIRMQMMDPKAEEDHRRSLALAGKPVRRADALPATGDNDAPAADAPRGSSSDNTSDFFGILAVDEESQDVVASRFTSLLTMESQSTPDGDLTSAPGGSNIRGRVQDRRDKVQLQPMFAVSYFNSPTELKPSGEYIREVTELNDSRTLRFGLQVTNTEPGMLDDDEIRRHFRSIEYYNSYIATHPARAVDFFGRAMDFYTLRDYAGAMTDFTRAVEVSPDFALGYLMRAVSRLKHMESAGTSETAYDAPGRNTVAAPIPVLPRDMELREVLADLDKVLELSPSMAIAEFDRGVVLSMLNDRDGAIQAFDRAIALKRDFGEAFYNRGYMYLLNGDRNRGTADLSHAGQLGVVDAYSVLKRMTD